MLYIVNDQKQTTKGLPVMKYSKSTVHRKYFSFPTLCFETQRLTSFSGLILFQRFFDTIGLVEKLRFCYRHLRVNPIFGHTKATLLLIIQFILGFRHFNYLRYFGNDPLVKRLTGLSLMPDPTTVSRILSSADKKSVEKLHTLARTLVTDHLSSNTVRRITADFDGSVISTRRHAENTAVGFNKKKKGMRSYYPLFCTIAQTGQVFDWLHRPGNVHDSHGAVEFVDHCFSMLGCYAPHAIFESRMDGAFFSEKMVLMHEDWGTEYSISVPFERLVELKMMIEQRGTWRRIDKNVSYFDAWWSPQCWGRDYRFIFVRTRTHVINKEPIQLDLFEPREYGYEYKVILTNKKTTAQNVIAFHNGRGSQEGIFAELKSQLNIDCIPFKRLIPNQIYLASGIIAHNLCRSFQIMTKQKTQRTSFGRCTHWVFEQIGTVRRNIINRAGRITNPHGTYTLTISGNKEIKREYLETLDALDKAA